MFHSPKSPPGFIPKLKIIYLSRRLSFHSLKEHLSLNKNFNFNKGQLTNFFHRFAFIYTTGSLLANQKYTDFILYFLFPSFFFKGLHLQHMEVPRLGVPSELQLLAYTRVMATQDPNCVCNLPQLTAVPDPKPTERGQRLNQVLINASRVHWH